jgi:TolB protein
MEPTDTRSRRSSSRRPDAALLLLLAPWGLLAARQEPPQPPASPPTFVITGPGAERLGVPDCVPRRGDEASRVACRTLTEVLRNDLKFEGLFRFVPESLMASLPALNVDSPDLIAWKGVGATVLVASRAEVTGGELSVEVRVHSVGSGQMMLSKRYSGRADNPRIFAHQASDEIMALAGNRGVARTKIAFASDRDSTSGARAKRTKELYICDYDGFNPRRVTVNGSLNILPAWSPDGRSLAYVSYRQGTPSIFVALIYEGRSANITTGATGGSFAPSFSPDGKRIAYASSRGGNMDIWIANADGSGAHRITTSPGLDTAPYWSPTGQEIAFTSDRSGSPQIYLMDNEGLNVRRLSNVGSWNDAPTWNPSKQFSEIAYTSRLENVQFEVAVIDLATRQVRQVSQGRGSCESPSWAPSGRHLVFSCQRGGAWQLTVADRLGVNMQVLSTGPGNNVHPDWGP